MKTALYTRKWLLFAAVCAVLLFCPAAVFADTCIYIGPKVSEDGTILIGRSDDDPAIQPNYLRIVNRSENEPGRYKPVDKSNVFHSDLPATTYQYTTIQQMSSAARRDDADTPAPACANECGVVMTMTATALSGSAALAADPLLEYGLTEACAADLVICQSASAREAVQVLGGLIDRYGASGTGIALIADRKEAWYVEIYSGHQYAAVKLRADKVCAFGNEFNLEYLKDYEVVVTSRELLTLPEKAGFAVYGRNGELNILKTYSGPETRSDHCHMRTWIAHQILAPLAFKKDYDLSETYPLCFTPEQKVSLQDVMELLRNRYEGTPYSPDETGRDDVCVIGTETAMNVHILQVCPDLPAEISCVTWESTGPAVYGAFVPFSNCCSWISSAYGMSQPPRNAGNFESNIYPWFTFRELNMLCAEQDHYEVCGLPVRAYWHEAETGMISGMADILKTAAGMADPDEAASAVTEYCNAMQEQVFSDAKELLNEVIWYLSENSTTQKSVPVPGTEPDAAIQSVPLKVRPDAKKYYNNMPAE